MRRLRVVYRLILVVAWTLAMGILRMTGWVFRPFAPRWDMYVRRAAFTLWARGMLRILNVKCTVTGAPPEPPFFSVSNHLTNIDLLLLVATERCILVARADSGQWPLVGYFVRLADTILIDRARRSDAMRVNEVIAQALERGEGIHVFAESRISQDGQVAPFKPPLLQPAAERQLPVHYATLSYATPEGCPAALDTVVWKTGVSLAQNSMDILSLPAIYASIEYGPEPVCGTDRKQLAEDLREAVRSRFVPLDSWRGRPPERAGSLGL